MAKIYGGFSRLGIKCWSVQAVLSQENQVVPHRWNLELNHQRSARRHHLDVESIFIWNIPGKIWEVEKCSRKLKVKIIPSGNDCYILIKKC